VSPVADATPYRPLADRMRPRSLADFVGQDHLVGPDKPLRKAIEEDRLHSMVFWGPPGTGKTTLARVIAEACNARFMALSAVLSGVKEIREAVQIARAERVDGRRSVLFVDEVHRFNKAQQDAFLPHIEDGTIYFIGATTENPSFELNNALLSRLRVYLLKPLAFEDLKTIVTQALNDSSRGLGARNIEMEEVSRELLARAADGDARRVLNLLEISADLAKSSDGRERITEKTVQALISDGVRRFDKGGDIFYDQISALHKSVRGSDPDASLYWLSRMLDGGCDRTYLARRIARMAVEDVGNADPRALAIALDAWDSYDRLGSPEGELALAQAVVYLACAAKSNAVYAAFNAAMRDAKDHGSLDVPLRLRNAPTQLMRSFGHGTGYRYAHDERYGYVAGESYFPDAMGVRRYYEPVDRGLESRIKERLAHLRSLDASSETEA
jgi:putative ATPase